jgi:hypothetical protein
MSEKSQRKANNFRQKLLILLWILLLTASPWQAKAGEENMAATSASPGAGSWAWQIEQFSIWLKQNFDLVKRQEDDNLPKYLLDSLQLSGSVEKNRLSFTLKGHALNGKAVQIPILGPVSQVILKNVTLNGQAALIGFDKNGEDNNYFIVTAARDFSLQGELSILSEPNLTVPGPINLISSDFSDGLVLEGKNVPGAADVTLHLQSGRKPDETKVSITPVFELHRAVRIRKEITFHYQIKVHSPNEVAQVVIPLKHQEIVLDVPGMRGWKTVKNELIVPTAGQQVTFSVVGRLPAMTRFAPDARSQYEWWLIESDQEHKLTIDSSGRAMDVSRSPIAQELSSAKLFLLQAGQTINVQIANLTSIDALAMVVNSHFRKLVWGSDGQLVAEDRITYNNNGFDYIQFNCLGKPLYFQMDENPSPILAEEKATAGNILAPVKKGSHFFLVQSLSQARQSFLGGLFRVPNAGHQFASDRSSLRLGLPAGIIPLWFFGGELIETPFTWKNLFFLLLSLLIGFFGFSTLRQRLFAFFALAGVYILWPTLYVGLFCLALAFFILRAIGRRLKGWKHWLLGGVCLAGFILLVLLVTPLYNTFQFGLAMRDMSNSSGSGGISGTAYDYKSTIPKQELFEMQMGNKVAAKRQSDQESEEVAQAAVSTFKDASGLALNRNMSQGVVPVAVTLPSYASSVTITREMTTPEKPLAPTLLYLNWGGWLPLLLFWLYCCWQVLRLHRKKLQGFTAHISSFFRPGN